MLEGPRDCYRISGRAGRAGELMLQRCAAGGIKGFNSQEDAWKLLAEPQVVSPLSANALVPQQCQRIMAYLPVSHPKSHSSDFHWHHLQALWKLGKGSSSALALPAFQQSAGEEKWCWADSKWSIKVFINVISSGFSLTNYSLVNSFVHLHFGVCERIPIALIPGHGVAPRGACLTSW